MKTEEQRIYVAVAGTIQVPASIITHTPKEGTKIIHIGDHRKGVETVVQPAGRQIAQACHVVSKLRIQKRMWEGSDATGVPLFNGITTIILQARDSAEMGHVFLLLSKRKLNPVMFSDNNPEYGLGDWPTAIAVFATRKQVNGIMDYLPLWSGQ